MAPPHPRVGSAEPCGGLRLTTITVGGLPGTGTTTTCRTLAQRLDLPWVYAGKIFRDMAKERGMSLAEFGRYCEEHPAVDRELDARQVQVLRKGRVILEGRLAGWMAYRESIDAFKVWLTCPTEVRIDRILEREGGDRAIQTEETLQRELSEQIRYRTFYGIDLSDTSLYDAVISTERTPPEGVVSEIMKGLHGVED